MLDKETKSKYIGFRLGFNQYIQVIKSAQASGVTVSDYILSLLLPTAAKTDFQPIFKSNSNTTKLTEDMSEKVLQDAQKRLIEINKLNNNYGITI